MAARSTVTVRILDREYRIRAEPDADPEPVLRAAALVDETMRRLLGRGGPVDTVDIAVLAALNLAKQIVARQGGGPSPAGIGAKRLDGLIAMLESALGESAAEAH